MTPLARRPRIRLPISAFLALGFGGLILLSVSAVFYLGFVSTRDNTRELLGYATEQLIESLVQEIEDQLGPVAEQSRWLVAEVESGRLDPMADRASFDMVLMTAMAAIPQIRLTAFVSPDEKLTFYDRITRSITTIGIDESPIAAERYRRFQDVTRPAWDEPFWSPMLKQMVMILGSPLFKDGRKVGMLAQAVTISGLSLRLASWGEQLGLTPYILYDDDRVLTHPTLINWRPDGAGEQRLPRLAEIDDGVLSDMRNPTARFDAAIFMSLTKSTGFGLEIDGRRFFFAERQLNRYGQAPWTVGAYIPSTAVRDLRNRVIVVMAGSVFILVLAAAAALWIGRRVSQPVHRLALAAGKIGAGDLAGIAQLPPSGIKEIDAAADAFNGMVAGLRERDSIRSIFGKYVPESIAARLLAGDGILGTQVTEATILFADIEGFTERSESMRPAEIVDMLNEYFSVLAEVIERHDGVITQFQGDAILATFNVPVPNEGHAAEALQAAIEIRESIVGRTFAGHRLECRIGINTGEVVAGAVGAADRLNYTVHGDAVNVAARLEALNKEFGTRILVSESTARSVSGFPLLEVGRVPVRGRSTMLTIYTVSPTPKA